MDHTMNASASKQLGQELFEAMRSRHAVEPLTTRYPGITIADAYAVQQEMLRLRLADGERVIGKKIGITSRAVMDMLKVDQPDFGWLTDAMVYGDGAAISADTLIQPKAEGEVAFLLKQTLRGPGVISTDVLRATEAVLPCFEIVDSRIRDWHIQIQDTVADNASCGAVVLGGRLVDPRAIDLSTTGLVLQKNGEVVATGAGAAALGAPANAVAWLANTLGKQGASLEAGEIVLSGSLATMIQVSAGDHLTVEIGGIGSCSVRFT